MLTDTPAAFAAALTERHLAMSAEAAAAALDMLSGLDVSALTPRASATTAERLYSVDRDGVATVPVHGVLVNRGSWLSSALGFSAYDQLRAALSAAEADHTVKGVLLDFDSPGGDLAGAVETASAVRALAARKPVVAFVDSLAASAAYVIAAAANRIVATPSATLGSIGVVVMHMDRSAAFAKRGVKPTLLHAGAYKIDGHSMAPLPPDARKRMEVQLAQAHQLILDSVGIHRPKLGVDGARKTEAGVYMGSKAVAAGLADAVGTGETARAYLLTPKSASPPAALAQAPCATVHITGSQPHARRQPRYRVSPRVDRASSAPSGRILFTSEYSQSGRRPATPGGDQCIGRASARGQVR